MAKMIGINGCWSIDSLSAARPVRRRRTGQSRKRLVAPGGHPNGYLRLPADVACRAPVRSRPLAISTSLATEAPRIRARKVGRRQGDSLA